MARYIAKNIVAAGLCDGGEVGLAYTIGGPYPVSVMVDDFGTTKVDINKLENSIPEIFDLTSAGRMEMLQLRNPIYQETATYGHFVEKVDAWEFLDKIKHLQSLFE